MKPLNDEKYKDALKSVKPKFDKDMLWGHIEQKIEKKKKRRFILFFFGSIGFLLTLLIIGFAVSSKDDGAALANSNLIIKGNGAKQEIKILNNTQKIERQKLLIKPNESKVVSLDDSNNDKIFSKNPSAPLSISKVEAPIKTTTNHSNTSKIFIPNKTKPNTILDNRKAVLNKVEHNVLSSSISISSILNNGDSISNSTTDNISWVNDVAHIYKIGFKPLKLNKRETSIGSVQIVSRDLFELRNDDLRKPKILITTAIGKPQSKYKANDASSQTWVNNISAASTDLYSLGLAASYNFNLNTNFSLSVGLSIHRVSERFNVSFDKVDIEILEKDSAIYIVTSEGKRDYYYGERIQTTTTTTEVQQYNHFYNVGLALGAMYTKPLSENISAYLEGAFTFNPLHFGVGKTVGESNGVVSVKENTAKLLMQVSAGFGLIYNHNERFNYQLGVQWDSDLTSRYSPSEFSLRKEILNFKLGTFYSL